jgi:predicted ester cyclase
MGIPPTGKAVEFTGIRIFRVADGKIAEGWVDWDTFGLMRQLGKA